MKRTLSTVVATILLLAGSVGLAQAGDATSQTAPVRLSDRQMDSVSAGFWWFCSCTGTASVAVASAQSVARGTTTSTGAFTAAIVSPGTAYSSSLSTGTVGR
jgi:hypothetical protein